MCLTLWRTSDIYVPDNNPQKYYAKKQFSEG